MRRVYQARKSSGTIRQHVFQPSEQSVDGTIASRKQFSLGWNNKDYSDVVLCLKEETTNVESPSKKQKLEASEREIYVSKLILASESPYFQKLFANGMKESQQNKITITLPTEEHIYFIDLLRFLYTGQFEQDLIHVAVLADKFDIDSALMECAEILKSELRTIQDCDRFLSIQDQIAHVEHLSSFLAACKDFAVSYYAHLIDLFHDKSKRAVFEDLHVQTIEAILQSNSLEVPSENAVYRALELWLNKEPSRSDFIPRLLPHIRFAMLSSPNFLRDIVACHPVISKSEVFKEKLMNEALYFGFSTEQKNQWRKVDKPLYKPRKKIPCVKWEFPVEVNLKYTWDEPKKIECWIDGYTMSVRFFTIKDRFYIHMFLMDVVQYLKLKVTFSVRHDAVVLKRESGFIGDWSVGYDIEVADMHLPPELVHTKQTVSVKLAFEFL